MSRRKLPKGRGPRDCCSRHRIDDLLLGDLLLGRMSARARRSLRRKVATNARRWRKVDRTAQRRAADELTVLAEEMGLYDDEAGG